MGLGLKITYKKEEINLTDFTIENHVRKVEDIPGRNEFLARNVNSLELNGKYSIYDVSKESLEVNKLACWYKVTAHEKSCYRKLELILKDNNDEEYDSLTFEKAFMVDYSEVFNFERGTIDFYALIREFNEEILEADGKSVKMDRKKPAVREPELIEQINDGKNEVAVGFLPLVLNEDKKDTDRDFALLDSYDDILDGQSYGIYKERNNQQQFVIFSNDSAYGGNQNWYSDASATTSRDDKIHERTRTGCGPIAISNVLLYYAQRNRNGCKDLIKTKNANIIDPNNITRQLFTNFAEIIYSNTAQMIVTGGVWFIKNITNSIKTYAYTSSTNLYTFMYNNKVILNDHTIDNNNATFDKAIDFIKNAFQNDYPVILFVRYNEVAKKLGELSPQITDQLHYVVITRLIERIKVSKYIDSYGKEQIDTSKGSELVDYAAIISTWGKRNRVPSFKDLWNCKNKTSNVIPNVGLVYYSL